eukprot:9502324-Pyramimonas_sp.AAC.1
MGTLGHLSRQLQLIGTRVRRDHMFLHLKFQLPTWTAANKAKATRTRWDRDKMLEAFHGDSIRDDFIQAVEERFTQDEDLMRDLKTRTLPDPLWAQIEGVMMEIGEEFFTAERVEDERYTALQAHRRQLLRQRQDLRVALGHTAPAVISI